MLRLDRQVILPQATEQKVAALPQPFPDDRREDERHTTSTYVPLPKPSDMATPAKAQEQRRVLETESSLPHTQQASVSRTSLICVLPTTVT